MTASQLRALAIALTATALMACNDPPTSTPTPAAMAANGTLPTTAAAGSTLSPAVRVTDSRGRAVSGAAVTFEVTAGGGSVSNSSVTTNINGVAALPGWFLGPAAGVNTLVARLGTLTPVTFTVTATDTELQKVAGDQTTCPAGASPGCRFTVRVRGPNGSGIANQSVLWTGPGGATLTTTTSLNGYATAPNLGPNGANGLFSQTARLVSSGAEVTFSYSIVTGGQFNIDLRFIGTITPSIQTAFTAVKARWEEVITGDLAPVALNQPAGAACRDASGNSLINHPAFNETVDDLVVFVQVDSIDGPGQVLGQAGPCLVRTSNRLPIFGMMRFDIADLTLMENTPGLLYEVMLHELAHVLGFPAVWTSAPFALLQDTASAGGNPNFIGARAASGFTIAGGTLINGSGVPVENTGSDGTRLAHWRESILSNELMTGFINSNAQVPMPRNPLSAITIGAMMDIGYQVNFGAADAYLLPGASALRLDEGPRRELIELPMPAPRMVH
jgi:hypothetical protein